MVSLSKIPLPIIGTLFILIEGVGLLVGVVEDLPLGLECIVGLDVVSRVGELVVSFPSGPTGACVPSLRPCMGAVAAGGVVEKLVSRRTEVVDLEDGSLH